MLILPAAPAAAVSGKQQDSIVYFSWRGNQAARTYATPTNPRSTNQTTVRTILAQLSQLWKSVSVEDRETWNTWSQSNPTKDRMGRDVTPSGINWFIKANSNRRYMGNAAVQNAPVLAKPAPLSLENFTVNLDGTITVDIPGTPATGYAIKAQIEIPPSVAWTPSQARSTYILGVNSASYETVAATANQTITFEVPDGLPANALVAVWYTTVRIADGTESTPTLFTAIVAP